MIDCKLTYIIREKLTNWHLIIFVLFLSFIGIIINYFEPYPLFYILFPLLIIMLTTTIAVLRFGLKALKEFNEICKENQHIFEKLNILFVFKEKTFISLIFIIMIIIYFVCLYQLGFFTFNIMGLFVFFLGGGTFLIALISYEMYLRVTIALRKISKDKIYIAKSYNFKNPKETHWLQYLYQLCKVLKNASLIIGVLFVLENSLIYIANMDLTSISKTDIKTILIEKISMMPLEFWIIWVFVFLSIGCAFPIIAYIQALYTKRILLQIQHSFNETIISKYSEDKLLQNPFTFYAMLSVISKVESSLEKTFLPQKIDRVVTILSAILTCSIHIVTLFTTYL